AHTRPAQCYKRSPRAIETGVGPATRAAAPGEEGTQVPTRRQFLAAAGAMALAPRARTRASEPVRIGQQKLKLAEGDRDGLLYVPQRYKPDVATPLVLMFHGAGSTALNVSYTFPIADALGFIVLAPDSRDEATWDMLLHGFSDEVEFIGLALRDTYGRSSTGR